MRITSFRISSPLIKAMQIATSFWVSLLPSLSSETSDSRKECFTLECQSVYQKANRTRQPTIVERSPQKPHLQVRISSEVIYRMSNRYPFISLSVFDITVRDKKGKEVPIQNLKPPIQIEVIGRKDKKQKVCSNRSM